MDLIGCEEEAPCAGCESWNNTLFARFQEDYDAGWEDQGGGKG